MTSKIKICRQSNQIKFFLPQRECNFHAIFAYVLYVLVDGAIVLGPFPMLALRRKQEGRSFDLEPSAKIDVIRKNISNVNIADIGITCFNYHDHYQNLI